MVDKKPIIITEIKDDSYLKDLDHIATIGITTIKYPILKRGKSYRTNYPLDDKVFIVSSVSISWTHKTQNSDGNPSNHVVAQIENGKLEGFNEQKSSRIIKSRFITNRRTVKYYKVSVDQAGREYFNITFDPDYKAIKIYLDGQN